MFKYRSVIQIRLSKLAAVRTPGLVSVKISRLEGQGEYSLCKTELYELQYGH